MSHTITIPRSIHHPSKCLNSQFISTVSGALKICQFLFGAVPVGIIGYHHRATDVMDKSVELFFLIVFTAFLMGIFIQIISSLCSFETSVLLPRTNLDITFNLIGVLFQGAAIILFYIQLRTLTKHDFFVHYLVLGIFAGITTFLYLVGFIVAIIFYRRK